MTSYRTEKINIFKRLKFDFNLNILKRKVNEHVVHHQLTVYCIYFIQNTNYYSIILQESYKKTHLIG